MSRVARERERGGGEIEGTGGSLQGLRTRAGKGFGYVQFTTEEAAARAAALGKREVKPAITIGRRVFEVRRKARVARTRSGRTVGG